MSTTAGGEPGRHMPADSAPVLAGRYRLIAQLGKGQAGVVYLAEDLRVGSRRVAVKMALDSQDPSRVAAARAHLLNEAQALAALQHPGVPRLDDVLMHGDRCALVLDYLPGRTLRTIAAEGPVAESQVLEWGVRLCDSVVHLHSRRPPLAHGAIQAGHCMLLPGGRLVLFDFGTATTRPGSEMARQDDVRAVALLLYQLLTGGQHAEEPFPSARSYVATISEATDRALGMTLQPAAEGPPLTAAMLRQQLLQCHAALGLQWRICPYCQATARAQARYCDICGGSLDSRSAATAEPSAAGPQGTGSLPPGAVDTPSATGGEEIASPPAAVAGRPADARPRRPRSYARRLRAIGRYIEQQELRHVTIVDSEAGLFVRGQTSSRGSNGGASQGSTSVLVDEEELEQLSAQASRRRGSGDLREQGRQMWGAVSSGALAPGYEDRLRTLGRELDDLKNVSRLTLIETSAALYVDYDRTGLDLAGGTGHQHLTLSSRDLDEMLALSRARRGTGRSGHSLRDKIQQIQQQQKDR